MTIIDTGDLLAQDIKKRGESAVLFTAYYARDGEPERLRLVDASGVDHDEDAARAWIELAMGDSFGAEPVRLRGWSAEWILDKGRWRRLEA